MATTSPKPRWTMKKKVVVYAPLSDVFCSASLHVIHERHVNQGSEGSISLHFEADLANRNGRSQALWLNFPPDTVNRCDLTPIDFDKIPSPRLTSMLRSSGNIHSTVSTLSLGLAARGTLFYPSEIDSLRPVTNGRLDFQACAMICQSEDLHIYFYGREFEKKQLDQLEIFLAALQGGSLRAKVFDHARHGLVQADWRALIESLDPPPYCEQHVSEQAPDVHPPLYYAKSESQQVVGKRRRGPPSVPSEDERQKRFLLSSPSMLETPTEVNTPSTLSPSRSIRPTHFTHACSPSRTEPAKLAHLVHELQSVSDGLIRELLIQSGHGHLLAKSEDIDSDLPCEAERFGSSQVEMLERRLTQYVNQTIEQRLDHIVNSAVGECRDQVYDECKTNEAEFRGHLDDANSELRITANDCMEEVKEEAQKHMREMEEQANQYMHSIEDWGAEVKMSVEDMVSALKRRFDTSAQSVVNGKSSLSHELGSNPRRTSI
ncbi:unnamed protein product [Penicillium salamii]|nr:unnamed protein product [Penicillium salamii]CAG8417706.1 unnamed protein product [Penicillium salamii]